MKESKTMKMIQARNKGLNVNGIKLDKPNVTKEDIERFVKLFIMMIPENKLVYTIMRKRDKFLVSLKELYELSADDINYFCERLKIEMGMKVDITLEELYQIEREMGFR